MNIHFKDTELFNSLKEATITKIKIGSHMYGLNNENSDDDYLYIYNEINNSFMWEHHQLQYKDNNIDYNFSNLKSFIRNALTGDSTINFEIIFSKELENTSLNFLYKNRKSFMNYNIIKSYLGMAKRDLRYLRTDTNNLKSFNTETYRKLTHFVRGVIFAKNILESNFSLDLSKTHTYKGDDLTLLKNLKNGVSDIETIKDVVIYFEELMNKTRNKLNEKHDNRTIVKFMEVSKLKEIDNHVKEISSNKNNKEIDYGDIFYEVLEKGISY